MKPMEHAVGWALISQRVRSSRSRRIPHKSSIGRCVIGRPWEGLGGGTSVDFSDSSAVS